MKKLLLGAFALLSLAANAADVTTYVTNKSQFTAAVAACEGMAAEDTHTIIICKSLTEDGLGEAEVADNSVVINAGYVTFKHNTGKLVIKSNQTDIDNLPQLQCGLNGMEHTADSKFSIFIENISFQYRSGNTATSGQILYWQKMACDKMQIDSVVFRNCDITNIPRTLMRTAPNATVDSEGNALAPSKINYLEMTGCKIHDINISKGNNWALFVLGSMPVEVNISNNKFYDMPYSKGIIQMAYVTNDGTAPKIYFTNNTVMLAKAKYGITPAVIYTQAEIDSINVIKQHKIDSLKQVNPDTIIAKADSLLQPGAIKTAEQYSNNGTCLINAGSYLAAGTEYYIMNNLFLGQEKGAVAIPTDNPDYTIVDAWTDIISASQKNEDGTYTQLGTIDMENNYAGKAYKALVAREGTEDYVGDETNSNVSDYVMDWTKFYKADKSNFILEKAANEALYNGGLAELYNLAGEKVKDMPSCIGAEAMYVDEFPVEAVVNPAISGGQGITFDVSPVKDTYFKGDEVTITLNTHNSHYRTFNTFKGWSDGNMDLTRTVTLDAKGFSQTATFEKAVDAVAAFDFSANPSSNSKIHEYVADLGDQAGTAKIFAVVADTTGLAGAVQTAAVPYVDGNFETRAAKFGEDDAELQMPIISCRTAKNVRDFNRNYAVIQFSTKGLKDATVDYFVGTDNNASKVQKAFYSLDNETYTDLQTDSVLVNGKWSNVKFNLPADALDKETVYIKLQGQVNNGDTKDNITYTDVASAFDPSNLYNYDVFEYLGNILITTSATSVKGDVNGDGKVTVADVSAIISVICKTDGYEAYVSTADVNGDGSVTVADVSAVINIICNVKE